ncbi:MAG: hypothetical protein AAF628_30545 [Planctomycetota bacterium]
MNPPTAPTRDVDQRRIVSLWWPLAASWLLMGAEMPLVVAAVSRLAEPKTHLAAISAIVYPISLLVEGPVIMLLAASTALARDRASYHWLRRFVYSSAALLTAVHVGVAFTPLYDVVAGDWLGAPAEALEPGRLGLRLMTPWTGMIAYRRFQQGVLIRFDRSRDIGIGTLVRLIANGGILLAGLLHGGYSGVAVGATAIAAGVTAEAAYAAAAVRPIRRALPARDPNAQALHARSFVSFYVPLAITPVLSLAAQPVGAAAMNRMPQALTSVASWGAVYGLIFLLRSFGFAFQEATVRLLDEPGGQPALRRFALRLSLVTSGALLLLWATPLARVWFRDVSGLPPDLVEVCATVIGLGVLMPAYSVWMNYYQGILVQTGHTRPVTVAVALYLTVASMGLWLGVQTQSWSGLPWALVSFTVAGLSQAVLLAWAARRAAATASPA